MRPSTLQRLFTFAKAERAEALENFTTEALAAAIADDPRPLLKALRHVPGITVPDDPPRAHVETQVRIAPGVIMDLVIDLEHAGQRLPLWIEVKAHSGLSGLDQITRYLALANAYAEDVRPALIMLCKRPLVVAVPTLRWNVLRAHIDDDAHVRWKDLRAFLEDQMIADDFDTPVTAAEISVADAAHRLLRKTARLAYEFLHTDLPSAWREFGFPESDAKILNAIARQFRNHRRMVVDSRRYPWVCFGLSFQPAPALQIWIELQGNDAAARKAIFAAAERGKLPAVWTRAPDGSTPWIGASHAVAGDLVQEEAIAWLTQRVGELAESGLLEELGNWRRQDRIGEEQE